MSVSVTVDSITTADAVTTTAPHKISNKATKTTATVLFTPSTDNAEAIRKWVMRLAPTNHNTGTLLGKRGVICGSGDKCGEVGSIPLAHPSGQQISEDITYAEAGAADGDYNVVTYAADDDEWSA